jgi:hypothetical protein
MTVPSVVTMGDEVLVAIATKIPELVDIAAIPFS